MVVRHIAAHSLQRRPSGRSEGLEEGDVHLHRDRGSGRGLQHAAREGLDALRVTRQSPSGSASGCGSMPRHSGAPSACQTRSQPLERRIAHPVAHRAATAIGTAGRGLHDRGAGRPAGWHRPSRSRPTRRRRRGWPWNVSRSSVPTRSTRLPSSGSGRSAGRAEGHRVERLGAAQHAQGQVLAVRPDAPRVAHAQARDGQERLDVAGPERRQPRDLVGEPPAEMGGGQHEVDDDDVGPPAAAAPASGGNGRGRAAKAAANASQPSCATLKPPAPACPPRLRSSSAHRPPAPPRRGSRPGSEPSRAAHRPTGAATATGRPSGLGQPPGDQARRSPAPTRRCAGRSARALGRSSAMAQRLRHGRGSSARGAC